MKRFSTAVVWLALALMPVLAIGFLLPVQPNDYWWYVRLGGDIVARHAIPPTDTFTFTRAGEPMVYHSWLSALVFWQALQTGGLMLTVFLRGLMLALFYGLLWQTCRLSGAGPRLSTVLTVIAALVGSFNWAMRPQIFSFPLFGLMLLSLEQWRQSNPRWVWLLPPLILLWVNLHGAFILGFLLAGAALLEGRGNRRVLLAALAGMLLASLANPRGWQAWQYVLTLLTNLPSQQLGAEWQPITTAHWQGSLLLGWLLLFAPLNAVSPNRLRLTDWVWFLGFGWMALGGVRYAVWFAVLLAKFSATLLVPLVNNRPDRRPVLGIPVLNGLLATLLITLPLALLPGIRETWWAQSPPVLSANTPVKATMWLAQQPQLPGPMWSDLAFSSYLIYALPQRPVWIDTRFELFPLLQWNEYVEISQAAPGWADLLQNNEINLLMLDPVQQSRLLATLNYADDWRRIYADPGAVIFAKQFSTPPNP